MDGCLDRGINHPLPHRVGGAGGVCMLFSGSTNLDAGLDHVNGDDGRVGDGTAQCTGKGVAQIEASASGGFRGRGGHHGGGGGSSRQSGLTSSVKGGGTQANALAQQGMQHGTAWRARTHTQTGNPIISTSQG